MPDSSVSDDRYAPVTFHPDLRTAKAIAAYSAHSTLPTSQPSAAVIPVAATVRTASMPFHQTAARVTLQSAPSAQAVAGNRLRWALVMGFVAIASGISLAILGGSVPPSLATLHGLCVGALVSSGFSALCCLIAAIAADSTV